MRSDAVTPVVEIAPSLSSTNTVLKERAHTLPHGYTLVCREQSAGRGQRGNTWEAAPGMNLTFSILLRPRCIAPAQQFYISEAVAIAIAEVIDRYLPCGMTAQVKWPNDIYVGDRKICGILIEHTLSSGAAISCTIAGAGVNINQLKFISDAPNPVSLAMLTGRSYNLDELLAEFARQVLAEFAMADEGDAAACARLHARFLERLWRNDGELHPFSLPDGARFMASIAGVAPDGRITLRDAAGAEYSFYFKEVAFVL